MYLAMNRFKVKSGEETAFETLWRNRDRRLEKVNGFDGFLLLRGGTATDENGASYTLYVSHSRWRSEDDFLAWLRSDAFRATHAHVGAHKDMYLGPPDFEGFAEIDGVD